MAAAAKEQDKKADWSAVQYLKFGNERTRPVYDLLSQVAPLIPPAISSPRIYDLGCGPGNSTKVLHDAFPQARITGVDSSKDMLSKARASFAETPSDTVDFNEGDLEKWSWQNSDETKSKSPDLLFSNAVFHWLRHASRLPTITRLFEQLGQGGVLAFQVPDNYHAPSHASMRTTALLPDKPYSKYFAHAGIGDLSNALRPDLDPIETPNTIYNALLPFSSPVGINIWRTEYHHVLDSHKAIVEWVKGTGLQPYVNMMGNDEEAKQSFLNEYEEGLKSLYPELDGGKVLLGYPRLFVVAVRRGG